MTSRICSTSWSVSCDTRRASGIPTFVMISLAFLGPIPWIYCSAITTRLLVGMLTPAMRATAIHSYCRRKRSGRRSSRGRFANDNATPSPFPRARYRSTSQLGCGLLMDSTAFRQPPRGRAFARSRLAAGALVPARFGGFGLHFRGLARGFLRARGAAGPASPDLGRLARRGLRRLLPRSLGRRLLAGRATKHLVDGASDLRDRSHAIDRAQHALKLVIGGKRRGLIAVGQQTTMQHVRIVVVAQHLAPRFRIGDPLLDAFEQSALVHLELDDGVELEALLPEHAVERMRLRHRARETIEDEAPARIGLVDTHGDDCHHHLVGHELA